MEKVSIERIVKEILMFRPTGKWISEWALIHLGCLLVAAGITWFLVPNDIAAGGVSGLAMVANSFFPRLPVGFLMIGMNIVLFVVGFIFVGPEFGTRTVYSSFFLSGAVWMLERFFPVSAPLTDDILVQLIFGTLLGATGMAIVFNQNASTGGTDITAKILNKYFNIDIGKGVLACDFFIVLAAASVFGLRIGMYAMLGVILNGFLVDNIIVGLRINKHVVIISRASEEIRRFIVEELESGATIYDGRGGWSGERKEVIATIVNRRKFIRLRDFIKAIDPEAFISANNIHEVLGEGFDKLA
ncbi:MAG: YitT family protein [Thermovirga sp.]